MDKTKQYEGGSQEQLYFMYYYKDMEVVFSRTRFDLVTFAEQVMGNVEN